jgi:DNA-binding CsgD family transcriptional regulator
LRRAPISNSPEPPLSQAHRDRSIPARRKARQAKAEREQGIVNLLNAGVSVAEIAAREGVSLKRMRNLVREILAKRMPQPPAEYLALQVSRLNESLLVSYTAMHNSTAGTNFEAVDRVIKIVRELDRYHGFAPREGASRPDHPQLAPPAQAPLALGPPIAEPLCDSEMAPQPIEKAQLGLG